MTEVWPRRVSCTATGSVTSSRTVLSRPPQSPLCARNGRQVVRRRSASVTWLTTRFCSRSYAHAHPCNPAPSTSIFIDDPLRRRHLRTETGKAPENSPGRGRDSTGTANYFAIMTSSQPTRRDGEATRQRLLRAALELYTTVGFRATTTPAIAARAGVAEGTIYRHFSGKEHLLNEVFRGAQRWGDHGRPGDQRGTAPTRPAAADRPPAARDRGARRRRSPACCSAAGTSSTSTSGAGRPSASSATRCTRRGRGADDGVVRSGPGRAVDRHMAGAGGVRRRAGRGPRVVPGRSARGDGTGTDAALGCDLVEVRRRSPA